MCSFGQQSLTSAFFFVFFYMLAFLFKKKLCCAYNWEVSITIIKYLVHNCMHLWTTLFKSIVECKNGISIVECTPPVSVKWHKTEISKTPINQWTSKQTIKLTNILMILHVLRSTFPDDEMTVLTTAPVIIWSDVLISLASKLHRGSSAL